MGTYERWRKLLFWLSVAFAVQGLSWALLGSFDPFGIWDGLAADALFDGAPPAGLDSYRAALLGPMGATDAAFFGLAAALVAGPLRRRERWAWQALAASFFGWALVDSAASIAHGALFNVLVVNLPAVVIYGVPLVILRRGLASANPGSTAEDADARLR